MMVILFINIITMIITNTSTTAASTNDNNDIIDQVCDNKSILIAIMII